MTDKNLPSVEYLRKRLRYEPETGKLFWRDCEDMAKKWRTRWADKEAFTAISVWGYQVGRINSLSFRAHRVAYAIYYGSWPRDQIDHINGVRSDNRISNLRGVTHQENMRNQSMHVNNTSGVCGVNWCRNTLKWRAQININGRNKSLGYYTTLEGATEARVKASRQHGYMDRHGT